MWLVVSGCCCKEVYRFSHITYSYTLLLLTLLQQLPYFFAHLKKVFLYIMNMYCERQHN